MGVSQGFESYNYIVNQWFAWHDSFLLSHHLNQNVTENTRLKPHCDDFPLASPP